MMMIKQHDGMDAIEKCMQPLKLGNLDSHDATTKLPVYCGNINRCYWKV